MSLRKLRLAAAERVLALLTLSYFGGESLVRPPERAGGNAHVHGLDEKALASAPPFDGLADDVLSALEGAVIVAHAAMWDVAFLRAEMKRAGRTLEISHWIDTLTLSRRAFGLDSHSLAALCKHFGIDPGKHHRATDDVRALYAEYSALSGVTISRELAPQDHGMIEFDVMDLNGHRLVFAQPIQ